MEWIYLNNPSNIFQNTHQSVIKAASCNFYLCSMFISSNNFLVVIQCDSTVTILRIQSALKPLYLTSLSGQIFPPDLVLCIMNDKFPPQAHCLRLRRSQLHTPSIPETEEKWDAYPHFASEEIWQMRGANDMSQQLLHITQRNCEKGKQ